MKAYNFSKFDRDIIYGDTWITLTKANVLRFTSGFYKSNNLQNYHYVIMFYDEVNNAIGFQLTNTPEKGAFKISTEKNNSAGSVSILSFLKANNIDTQYYHGRYEWHKENIDFIGEIFVIDLGAKPDEIPF